MEEKVVSQTLVTHAIRMNVAKRNNSIRFRGFDFTFFSLLCPMFVLALSRFTVTFQPSANIDFHLKNGIKYIVPFIHQISNRMDLKKTQSIYCGTERMWTTQVWNKKAWNFRSDWHSYRLISVSSELYDSFLKYNRFELARTVRYSRIENRPHIFFQSDNIILKVVVN